MTAISTTPFDPASHLDDIDIQAEMLSEALATGNRRLVAHVLNTIARAKGMSKVAATTGINRTTLYAALAEDSNPTLETLFKVVDALGLRLGATPVTQAA